MKLPHLALALFLLLAAAVLGFYANRGGGETPVARDSHTTGFRGANPAPRPAPREAAAPRAADHAAVVRDDLRVTAGHQPCPSLFGQAQSVNSIARNRLAKLVGRLGLTPAQQERVFPLLARSAPSYTTELHIVGAGISGPRDPLSKSAADAEIHQLLDPEQQLELEIEAARADVWWSNLIAGLEQDLKASTTPGAEQETPAAAATTEKDSPPPAPRRGANLFDLLQEDDS